MKLTFKARNARTWLSVLEIVDNEEAMHVSLSPFRFVKTRKSSCSNAKRETEDRKVPEAVKH